MAKKLRKSYGKLLGDGPEEGSDMKLKVPFLVMPNEDRGRAYYRREIPSDLRSMIGKREWRVSLKRPSRTRDQLVRIVEELGAAHDALIAALRAGEPLPAAVRVAVEAEARALANNPIA